MKTSIKLFFAAAFLSCSFAAVSQVNVNTQGPNIVDPTKEVKLNPEKVAKYEPYVKYKHGGDQGYAYWKSTNTMLYAKEMYYYTESFYVKRNYLMEGYVLNEEIIDISRFETSRKQSEEAIVTIPGFKDVIVLLPKDKISYIPN